MPMRELFTYRSKMPASLNRSIVPTSNPVLSSALRLPGEKVRILSRTGNIDAPGSRVTLRVSAGPFAQDWSAEHTSCEPGRYFRDVMVSGPFPKWEHTHKFLPDTATSSWLEDSVEYDWANSSLALARVAAFNASLHGATKLPGNNSLPARRRAVSDPLLRCLLLLPQDIPSARASGPPLFHSLIDQRCTGECLPARMFLSLGQAWPVCPAHASFSRKASACKSSKPPTALVAACAPIRLTDSCSIADSRFCSPLIPRLSAC